MTQIGIENKGEVMKKLLGNIKRMWLSLRGIFSTVTATVTKGTGTAVKTAGGAIGTGIAFLVLISILIIVAIAAIPYGAFAANTEPLARSSECVCGECGQVDTALFRCDDDTTVCGDCLRDSQMPESDKPELPRDRLDKEGKSPAKEKGN